MRTKLLMLLLIAFFANVSCIAPAEVYLCDSKGGKKYHLKSTCRGLSNCQHKVIKVTLEKAKSMGKTLCGFEK